MAGLYGSDFWQSSKSVFKCSAYTKYGFHIFKTGQFPFKHLRVTFLEMFSSQKLLPKYLQSDFQNTVSMKGWTKTWTSYIWRKFGSRSKLCGWGPYIAYTFSYFWLGWKCSKNSLPQGAFHILEQSQMESIIQSWKRRGKELAKLFWLFREDFD